MVDTSPQTQVGPGNVISANLVGVVISGSTIAGITVIGNLIGTDSTGEFDLGNAFEGVLIDGAGGVTIEGDGQGSQVISGNLVGVEINGAALGAPDRGQLHRHRQDRHASRCPTRSRAS